MATKIREITQISEQDLKNHNWNNKFATIAEKDESTHRSIYWKYKIDKYYALTKKNKQKNCMLEFLKKQEILRKQNMEKFQKQRQEDLERHQKELEEQEERFSKLLETFSKRKNGPCSSNIFSQDSVIKSIGEFVYKPDEEVTFGVKFRKYKEIFQKYCVTWSDGKSTISTG